MTSLAELGAKIAAKRQKLELRQIDLAKRARVSRATLAALENGKASDIKWINLTRLLHALELELVLQPSRSETMTFERLLAETADD